MRSLTYCLPLLLAALPLAGCTTTEAMGDVQLVAALGDSIFLSIVADDGDVLAYACNGVDDTVSVYGWYPGSNNDGAFEIHGYDESVLRGTFADGEATGTLTLGGTDYPFTARAATGDDGLYHAINDELKGGWVVMGSDDRGAVINRTTGDLITGVRFNQSGVTVNGLTLVPVKVTSPGDIQ